MYAVNFSEIAETENLPGNFRRAVTGKEMGINKIRWVHPTVLPEHVHHDAEQAVIMLSGRISLTINDLQHELDEGDVAVIPRGSLHSGHSLEGEAVFIEVFSPTRIENVFGFLGDASVVTGSV
jgi:quercetin dioxygenase-like cupin family protein